MTEKVIYVSFVRLTDKMSRDWYIDFLIGKGVKVEYWDIVALVRDEYNEANAKETDYLRIIRTYDQLEAMLRLPENKNAYYVMLASYLDAGIRLFRMLSKYNCRMLVLDWGAMPDRDMQRLRRPSLSISGLLRLAKRIYYRVKGIAYRKLSLVKPFDIAFVAGRALMTENYYANRVVPINLADYDHYKKAKAEGGRLVAGRYAVFLDVYLPYHADSEFAGGQTVNPQAYYAALNRFFGLLEVKFGVKVVIAAHPKANYSEEQFQGREIYHLRTPELVRDAEFVIAHHSTSLCYAVLNNKPLLFIYTNEMASLCNTIVSYLYGFAKYLDAPIFNLDEIAESNQIVIKEVNPGCYENYKYDFLTSHESEHETTQEIFWREINLNQKEGMPVS